MELYFIFLRNWPLYFNIIIILVNLNFWKQQPHFCCMATFVQSMTGQNLTFKVNFQCQEPCQSFWKRFFPFKNSSLGEHGVLLTFLYYSIFYSFNFWNARHITHPIWKIHYIHISQIHFLQIYDRSFQTNWPVIVL